MRKLNSTAGVVAIGTSLVAVLGTGIAYAAWSSSGAGTGSAASGTSTNAVIAGVTPVVADDLYPGATKTAKVTITNPNSYPVVVTSISAGYSRLVNTDCAEGTVRTDALALTPAGVTRSDVASAVIAPSATGTYTLVLRMANDPHNACKSQTFVLDGALGENTTEMTATIESKATAQSF